MEAELGIREHIHDFVDSTSLQKRFSSIEANAQIINVPISNLEIVFAYLKGSSLEMLYVISLGCVSLSYSSSYLSYLVTGLYSNVFNVFVVLVGSTVSTSEITTLAMTWSQKSIPELR